LVDLRKKKTTTGEKRVEKRSTPTAASKGEMSGKEVLFPSVARSGTKQAIQRKTSAPEETKLGESRVLTRILCVHWVTKRGGGQAVRREP